MPDSAWSILANTLAALATATLLWAVFADLIRQSVIRRITKTARLRRCPKCWYDMRHTPGRTCSECGYTAKRERLLFKSRQSKRGIVFALILFMASYACIATPRMMKRGWVGALPTTGLVLVVPWMQVNESDLFYSRILSRMPVETKPLPLNMVVPNELVDRIVDDALSEWQWAVLSRSALRSLESIGYRALSKTNDRVGMNQYFLSRAEQLGPGLPPSLLRRALKLPPFGIRTRSRWPVDVPLQVEIEERRALGNDLIESRIDSATDSFDVATALTIGLFRQGTCLVSSEGRAWSEFPRRREFGIARTRLHHPRITITSGRLVDATYGDRVGYRRFEWADTVELPITFVDSINDVLQPISSDDLDSALRNSLDPLVHGATEGFSGRDAHLHLDFAGWIKATSDMDNLTLAAKFEVVHDGIVEEVFSAWWDSKNDEWKSYRQRSAEADSGDILSFESEYGRSANLEPSPGTWELRIVSDPELALRNFDCDRYWEGDILIPLRWGDPEQY